MPGDRARRKVRGSIILQGALPTLIVTASILSASCVAAVAGETGDVSTRAVPASDKSNEELLKKLRVMERRIEMLEGKLKQKQEGVAATAAQPQATAAAQAATASARAARAQAAGASQPTGNTPSPTPTAPANNGIIGLSDSPLPGLSIGAYGEVKFGTFQNPDAGGKWQNGFDVHRMVLLPTYAITSNIIFNAEIEFEHGGIAFDADDKRHGTAEIEQLWIDFKMHDKFNWRSPGVDLVPIGYINQHHEPTQFYSVNRPELYNGLIPSTFMVPATSIYGTLMDGLRYQFQASSSVEDFGDDFDKRTDGNSVSPFPSGYAAGITGLSALADSRPVIGDFRQLNSTIAYAGKLDFAPPVLPGFAGSVSAYYSPNITPRGAYADTGASLGRNSLLLFDAEFRYRVPNTGLELRGEYVRASFGNPANLRANNDSDPTNNVGKSMFGYSGEVAYHFPLGTILNSEWEAVPFYRYTYQNLQTNGFVGTDVNAPTGAGQLQFHTAGIAVFPSPKVVLKATYQKVINKDPAGANSDSVLGGVGFFF
jgi:hypothetical protein